MVPVVLSSEDQFAPPLTGEDGAGYAVIKWAAPLLGWTIEFDDPANHKIVIRSNPAKGPGRYYRFYDRAVDHNGDGRHMAVKSFASMTTVDDGLEGYPDYSTLSDQIYCAWKSNSTSNTPRPYWIVGTDQHFYLFTDPTNTGSGCLYYLGDFDTHLASDAHNAILFLSERTADNQSSSIFWSDLYESNRLAEQSLAADYQNLTTGVQCRPFALNLGGIPSATATFGTRGSFPQPISGGVDTAPVYIYELGPENVRGRMPGLYGPSLLTSSGQSTHVTGDTLKVWTDRGEIDCLLLQTKQHGQSSFGSYGAFLLDIETDWQ